jgi:flagellar protein FliO/FliZ
MQSAAQMVFWLVVVLLLIPASLWLVKRTGWAGRTPGALAPEQMLRTVAQTNLGPGQRVVTLEVNAGGDRTWLILGVTGQTITTLSQMPAQQPQPPVQKVA